MVTEQRTLLHKVKRYAMLFGIFLVSGILWLLITEGVLVPIRVEVPAKEFPPAWVPHLSCRDGRNRISIHLSWKTLHHNRYVLNGRFEQWYDNDQKENDGMYSNGKREGLWKQWRPDGTKEGQLTYKDDALDGPFTTYDSSGNEYMVGTYVNGLAHGTILERHPNGKVAFKTPFENGNRHGLMIEYDQDGNEISTTHYTDGMRTPTLTE